MSLNKIFSQSLVWRIFYVFTVLLQNVFFSRYFQADNSGWIYYLTNVLGLVVIISSLSFESGFTYYTANNEVGKGEVQLFALFWSLVVAGIGILTSGFFILSIPHTYPLSNSTLLLFTVMYVAGMVLTNYLLALFYAASDFLLPNLIIGVINIVVVFIIPKATHLINVESNKILQVYFMLPVVQACLLFVFYSIKFKTFLSFMYPSGVQIKKIVQFSFVALGANIIFFLINRADYYFVQTYCSKSDLGNYIQVSRLGQMLLIIPQVLASVVFPQVAKGIDKAEVLTSIIYLSRLLSRMFLLAFIVNLLIGKWLFTTVFGSTFSTMHLFFSMLLPGLLALSVLALVSAYFLGEGKVKVNFIGTIIGLIVLLIGDWLIVPHVGAVGAACISSVAFIVNAFYSISHLKQAENLNYKAIFTWKKEELLWIRSFLKKA